jgi:DNA-binding CsgD family transcriptional regulator
MVEAKQLQLTSDEYFYTCWASYRSVVSEDLKSVIDYFKPYYKILSKLALGEYFWYIFDNDFPTPKVHLAGGATEKLTSCSNDAFLRLNAKEYFDLIHPDDVNYAFSFLGKSFKLIFSLSEEQRQEFNSLIYYRVKAAGGEYRWMAVQYPAMYFDEKNRFLYGLCLISDVHHLIPADAKPMMTILNGVTNRQQHFTCYTTENMSSVHPETVSVSKTEKLILSLLAQGKASKEIGATLGLAKNTIDNYRQRLLKKFQVSSSAELVMKVHVFRNNFIS